jgi:hypothetical protein
MFFRGMGAPKPSFANAQVSEIDTMRNPDIAKEAGSIFSKLSPADIKAQAQKLKSTFTDEVIKSTIESSGIANAPHIISTLIKRRNQIVATYA